MTKDSNDTQSHQEPSIMIRKTVFTLLLLMLFLAGCSGNTANSTGIKSTVEKYIAAANNKDHATCMSLITDDIVISQDPPGIKIEGKDQFEALVKEQETWNHIATVTTPLKVDGDTVTFSVKTSSDDFKIMGIDYINAKAAYRVREGKIYAMQYTLDSQDWARVTENSSGGIGIRYEAADNGWKISQFAVNSPAQAAGLKQGDIIIDVNGVDFAQMRPGEMELRIKGAPGSKVRLTVARENSSGPLDFEVTRMDLTQLKY